MSSNFPVLIMGACYCTPVFCVRERQYVYDGPEPECGPVGSLLSETELCENIGLCGWSDIATFPHTLECRVEDGSAEGYDWLIIIREALSVHEGMAACVAACGEGPL